MSRIGADVKFLDGVSRLGDPRATLEALAGLGFDGVLVRTLDEAFPELDAADIEAFAHRAEELGMFVRVGLGKINPYMTAELPRVRRLGGGSYLAGMQRMIRICAVQGWTEAWTAVSGFKPQYPAPYCFDRFRTDVTWAAQLEATSLFLDKLVPTLIAEGVRLDIETHEELTTPELLRLVEPHGADAIGVCLDPANLPILGETPLAGTRRVAPYVHLTHLRDIVLVPTEDGISRFLMPIGDGQIDWPELLAPLAGRDDIDYCIEGVGGTRAEMRLQPRDPAWRAAHPELDEDELAELEALARAQAERIAAGEALDLAALRTSGDPLAEHRDFLSRSLAALRGFLDGAAAAAPAHR